MKFEKLGNIATIKTGKYDVNHSTPDGIYVFYTCAFGQFKSPTYSFEGPAIILPGNGANVGEVFFFDGKFEAYQRTYVVQNFKADPNYLYAYFKSQWKNSLRNKQFGSATNYIRLNNLTDFPIPIPSISDQLHIANILSKAESLIAQRKESIALLDEFLKSTFLEMFGDNTLNNKGWDRIKLMDACSNKNDVKCGPFGTQLSKSEYQTEGVPVWGIPQINSLFKKLPKEFLTAKKAKELSEYSVISYDIVMSRKGNVGKCSLFPKDFPNGIIHSDVLRIRTDKQIVQPVFLLFQLKYSKHVEIQIKGVTKGAIMAGINVGLLKHIKINKPPIELQTQFAQIVEKTEALKTKYQSSLQELENLYGSLSQKAFKGELNN